MGRAETDTTTYLIFSLRQSLYGVKALAVREILALPALTPLDETPRYVAGMVNLRGTLVPVLDLDLRFGRERRPYRLEDRLVVLEWEGRPAGIIVSEVHDVRRIDAEAIAEPPCARYARSAQFPVPGAQPDETGPASVPPGTGHRAPGAAFLAGIAKTDEALVMLLDLDRLLSLPEIDAELGDEESERAEDGQWTEEQHALLRERARTLAGPIEAQDLRDRISLVVVRLNDEPFGFDPRVVREFAPLRQVTPVPCCPAHIVGQMNLRGDILTVVDIRAALTPGRFAASRGFTPGYASSALPGRTAPEGQRRLAGGETPGSPAGRGGETPGAPGGGTVMVIQSGGLVCGVLVDEALDVTTLRLEEVMPMPEALRALAGEFVTGTAPFGTRLLSILDLPRLLAAGNLIVNEEP